MYILISSPYQLKKLEISHTHTNTQLMQEFSFKTGTDSGNTHIDGFICHLYSYRSCSRMYKTKYEVSQFIILKFLAMLKLSRICYILQKVILIFEYYIIFISVQKIIRI